jgi:hypothetical protein
MLRTRRGGGVSLLLLQRAAASRLLDGYCRADDQVGAVATQRKRGLSSWLSSPMPATICPTRYKLMRGTQPRLLGLTLGAAYRHQPRCPRRASRVGLRAAFAVEVTEVRTAETIDGDRREERRFRR